MVIPRWSTIGLFVMIVTQFILLWTRWKKTGDSFQTAVLPGALLALAVSIIFVRSFFEDVPIWIDAPLTIFCLLVAAIVFGLWIVWLKRYIRDAWRLDSEKHKYLDKSFPF